jgi:hypothetical protein
MFQKQIKRVKANLLPFAIIGLLIGMIIGKASWFRSFGWISDYLKYAEINTRYPDSGQIIFLNHFDAGLLTLLLAAMFVFAGFTRLFLGAKEREHEEGGFTQALENFGSLLSVAWIGLILGIAIPTLIFQGLGSFVRFFLYIVYPLLFLIEVSLCTAFLSSNGLDKIQQLGGKFGVRLEGLVLVAMGVLVLTYMNEYLSAIGSFFRWVNRGLL